MKPLIVRIDIYLRSPLPYGWAVFANDAARARWENYAKWCNAYLSQFHQSAI